MVGRPSWKKNFFDRRTRVQTAGESRHDAQSARFECRDHAVIVFGIAGQHVGAQAENPDDALVAGDRQRIGGRGDAALHARVVRRRYRDRSAGSGDLQRAAQAPPRTIGIAVDQRADQCSRHFGPNRQASIAVSGNRRGHPAPFRE